MDKSAVFLIAVGLFAIVEATRLDIGRFSDPGPGLFPFLAGLSLAVFSVILVVKSRLKAGPKATSPWGHGNILKVVCVLGTVLSFRLLLPLLGYPFTAFLSLVVLIKIVGGRRWAYIVFWSILFSASSYVLFGKWLMVQFPRGLFSF